MIGRVMVTVPDPTRVLAHDPTCLCLVALSARLVDVARTSRPDKPPPLPASYSPHQRLRPGNTLSYVHPLRSLQIGGGLRKSWSGLRSVGSFLRRSSFVRQAGHARRPGQVGVGDGHQECRKAMTGGRRMDVCLVSYGTWT